ncbi:MAG: glycosyltransferase [Candidatus Omnitrophota bacterium]
MNNIKFSVIIPTHTRTALLLGAIKSLEKQTMNNYEVIIVDNACSEEVKTIVEANYKSFAAKGSAIKYIPEPKIGLHNVRHRGAKAARGDILVYIDDDVICDENLLDEILKPYSDSNVGCVGGKILPKWEVIPPEWIHKFPKWYLSLLDDDEGPKEKQWLYGCNFSIRKSLLFELGGFNPDSFYDKKMWWARGDGEIGLLRKVHILGKKVIYNPRAIVWHFIPKERLAIEFFQSRAFKSGVETSFTKYHYSPRLIHLFRLLPRAAAFGLTSIFCSIEAILLKTNRFKDKVNSAYYKGRCFYEWRLAVNKELQQFIKQKNWIDNSTNVLKNTSHSIALVLNGEKPLSTYPSVCNTARLMAENGYDITLFIREDMKVDCTFKNIKIIKFKKTFPSVYGLFKILTCYAKEFDLLIPFHPEELIAVGLASFICRVPFIYFCLEIIDFDEIKTFKARIRKHFEVLFNKNAVATIVQDDVRKELIKKVNKIDNANIFCVPNSYIGVVKDKSDYLRRKYNIEKEKTVILYAGALERWAIDVSLIEGIRQCNENCVFVLHGWSYDGFLGTLKPLISTCNESSKKIYLSLDVVGEEEYSQLVSSADIGLVWYRRDFSNNVSKVGLSSGKFASFLRCGVPIIIPVYLEELKSLINKYNIGSMVENEFGIKKGIESILINYSSCRENAFKFSSQHLDFSKNFNCILKWLNIYLGSKHGVKIYNNENTTFSEN